jgi:hypothetical protein
VPYSDLIHLSPLHEEAALRIAQGHRQVDIAEHCQVAPDTVHHWVASPIFAEKVEEFKRRIQAEMIGYSTHKIAVLQGKAVDRLEYLMEHAESESVQLGAVKEVLDRGPLVNKRANQPQELPGSKVVLEEKLLVAMRRVAIMTGDTQMQQALQPVEPLEGDASAVEL